MPIAAECRFPRLMTAHRHQVTVVTPLQVWEINHIKAQFCSSTLPSKEKAESREGGDWLCAVGNRRTSGSQTSVCTKSVWLWRRTSLPLWTIYHALLSLVYSIDRSVCVAQTTWVCISLYPKRSWKRHPCWIPTQPMPTQLIKYWMITLATECLEADRLQIRSWIKDVFIIELTILTLKLIMYLI